MGMIRRYRPKHRAAKVRDERSNTFAVFIVALPVVLGAFGMGLDTSRNIYIRTTLQNALDTATVAGAAEVRVTPSGQVQFTNKVFPTVEHFYARNRAQVAALTCPQSYDIASSPLRRCWKAPSQHRGVGTDADGMYVAYGVRERSKNAFLQTIGKPNQDYLILSRARVNQDTQ